MIPDMLGKMIRKFLVYTTIDLNGRIYTARKLWFFGKPSPGEQQDSELMDTVIRAILQYRAGAVIDVGANMGQTLMRVLSIDRSREYIGFEPNPACSLYVEQFLKINRLNNCSILPVGLSDKFGIAKLLVREGDTFTSSVIKGFRPSTFYSHPQFVFLARGDDVISDLQIESISAVKIDVEGGELEVIRGLRNTLASQRPFIIFEVLPYYLAVTNESLDKETIAFREGRIREMENIMRETAYSIFQIRTGNIFRKLDKIEPQATPDLLTSDYLAIPSGQENNFMRRSDFTIL